MGRPIKDNRISNQGCLILDRKGIPKARNQLGKYSELDIRKSKHRSADSKYRSKVQFMYSKVREITKVQTTKDALLNDALKFIIRKEKQLYKKLGKRNFEEFKKEFLRFIRLEEILWKSEMDVDKWWNAVENSMNHKHTFATMHLPVFDENAGFEKICHIHDEEWAYQNSEEQPLTRKQSSVQSATIDSVNHDERLDPTSRSNLSNSSYMVNDDLYYSKNLSLRGDQYPTETCNEIMIPDLGLFALNKPLEFCDYRSPTEAGIYDSTVNNISSTLISL